jgi:hypothetical protein
MKESGLRFITRLNSFEIALRSVRHTPNLGYVVARHESFLF